MLRVARFAGGFVLGAAIAVCVVGAWVGSHPRRDTGVLLVGRERVTVGHVSIAGLPDWIYLPGADGAEATWTLLGPHGQLRARFAVCPLLEAMEALGSGTEAWRRSITVGGLDATWIQFRPKDGGVVGLALFDDGIGMALGTCLLAWALEGEWKARAPDFREIVSGISIRDEELEAVAGTEADAPPTAWLARLERLVAGPPLEGSVLRGARPVRGALVRLRADAPPAKTGPPVRPARPRFPLGGPTPIPTGLDARVLAETVTDEHGVFRFEGVPAGWVSLETSAGQGTLLRVRTLAPGPSSVRRRLVLQLGSGTLVGHARDRAGDIPTDVVMRATAEVHGVRREIDTRLDEDGHFRFDGLPGGEWRIDARGAAGRGTRLDPAHQVVRMPWTGSVAVDLGSTDPLPPLSGRVRTRTGVGVPGPDFRLLVSEIREQKVEPAEEFTGHFTPRSPPVPPPSMTVELDANGCFEQRLPVGRYRVQLVGEAWDRPPIEDEVAVEPGGSKLMLTVPGVVVRGRVGASGASLPVALSGADVWITMVASRDADDGPMEEPQVLVMAPLSRDGTFTLYGVAPGSSLVQVQAGTSAEVLRPTFVPLEVPEFSDVAGVQLELPSPSK